MYMQPHLTFQIPFSIYYLQFSTFYSSNKGGNEYNASGY